MSTTVQIDLDRDVFEQLQSIAQPLVDTPNMVIRRLLAEHKGLSEHVESAGKSEKLFFLTSRGERVPLGKLRATYKPRNSSKTYSYEAEVTLDGIKFDEKNFPSPSAAGIHAKKLAGADDTAAHTNGWTFWEHFDTEKDSWISLDVYR